MSLLSTPDLVPRDHVASKPAEQPTDRPTDRRVDWWRILPFLAMHAACLLVLWVGWSPVAVAVAVALYLVRMFGITAFYHRYFSHRTFEVGRVVQFCGAVLGAAATQRGPLWWAAHHRRHHRYSDTVADAHSPHAHGFWWAHVGWFTNKENFTTDLSQVPDFARYPELRWLDRYDVAVPLLLLLSMLGLGFALQTWWPETGTGPWQMAVWGYCISTTVLFHATSSINSLGHLMGRRVWPTKDQSRNSALLALLTLGEGWHNNHHWCPGTVRQGFRWWEVDVTYYVLRGMAAVGLVAGIRPLPARARAHHRRIGA